jgi:hypothetical protein
MASEAGPSSSRSVRGLISSCHRSSFSVLFLCVLILVTDLLLASARIAAAESAHKRRFVRA